MIFRKVKKETPKKLLKWHNHFVIFKVLEDPSRCKHEYVVIFDIVERRRVIDTFDRWEYRVSIPRLKKLKLC